MKTMNRIFSSLLACLVLLLVMAPAVSAADHATIDITDKGSHFVFQPGSEYSDSDLFYGFKNVFPGDTITQEVHITHKHFGFNKLKLYMRAVPHTSANLPQTAVLENEESVAQMNEFLSQLKMKVWKGRNRTKTPIFNTSPDNPGGLKDFILLGEFKKGLTGVITVQLEVPITMDNEFANRMGEVDWEFMIEEVPNPIIPQTGDQTNIGLLIGISLVSLAALVIVVILILRKKKNK